MVEQSKSANRHKVVFEPIHQPHPDSSPGLDDSYGSEVSQHQVYDQVLELRGIIKGNSETIAQLLKKSSENAILISTLSEERKNLIKYYRRVDEQYYRHQVNAVLKMSLEEQQPGREKEMTYEELISIGEKIGVVNVGLNDDEIALIPEIVVDKPETCSICLNSGSCGKVLLCNHFFHSECIAQWLKSKKSCPCCMNEVIIDNYY